MRQSAHLQGLATQAWAKPGLGETPHNAKKYGMQQAIIRAHTKFFWTLEACITVVQPALNASN